MIGNNDVYDAIARIEALEAEKTRIADAIKEVYDEFEDAGHNKKVLKEVIKRRKWDRIELEHHDACVAAYWIAMPGTPLEDAIKAAADRGGRG